MTPPILDVRNLEVGTPRRMLVADLSFRIDPGCTLALIGESGSGKSMTASAVMGLLPPGVSVLPGSEIRLDGERLDLTNDTAMRRLRGRDMAMVFQDPMSCLNPYIRVGRQIDEALCRLGMTPAATRRARLIDLMDAVELPAPATLRQRYPHELSGGQQQRVMLAMVLAAEPKLLIADEPTSALDASVQAEILKLLHRLQAQCGMAMLFITHDLAVAARLARDVVVMSAGRAVEQGTVEQVLRHPKHAYTRALVSVRDMLATPPGPTAPSADAVLAVDRLRFTYPARGLFQRNVPALDDVSISLAARRTLGIIGESGSGKSTLASIIAGLTPGATGDVRLFGQSLAAHRWAMPRDLRRRCQIVFQDPYGALNPRRTIGAALREPLDLLHIGPAAQRPERVTEALLEVGLEAEHAWRYPHQLSGGQRQRVCIARALASRPDLLVCDEVVSALDAGMQAQILQLLRRLQDERGFAMLFISHDLEIVRWIADDVAVMHHGRVVDCGPTARVIDAPSGDYARQLMSAVFGDQRSADRAHHDAGEIEPVQSYVHGRVPPTVCFRS